MARRVPLTTLSSVPFPNAVENAVRSGFLLSTTYRDKVEQLAAQYGATGEEHPVMLKRKRKRKAPNLDLRTMLRKERKAPKSRKTTKRRKKQNSDLRTMMKRNKFDIQTQANPQMQTTVGALYQRKNNASEPHINRYREVGNHYALYLKNERSWHHSLPRAPQADDGWRFHHRPSRGRMETIQKWT